MNDTATLDMFARRMPAAGAIGRVAGYLLQAQVEPGAAVSLPSLKKHIASHLNLTSETLSRTLRQLRDERLIGETDAGLVIHNARGLQRIAEGVLPTHLRIGRARSVPLVWRQRHLAARVESGGGLCYPALIMPSIPPSYPRSDPWLP